MRFRSDIVVGTSRVRDVDDRVWRINETREVGRRRWLDVAMSSYDLPADVDPDGDSLAGDPAFAPPSGWYLQWRLNGGPNKFSYNSRYVDQLVVAQSERALFDGDGFSIGDVKFFRADTGSGIRGQRRRPAGAPGQTCYRIGSTSH